MKNKIVALFAPVLGVVLCLTVASSASARHPRVYYPGYAPAVVVGYGYGGVGYAAAPYGYTYNPARVYRQSLKYAYPPLTPKLPMAFYAYPYYGYGYGYGVVYGVGYGYGYIPQPVAPVRGPRDYFYRPETEQPQYQPSPTPAAPMPQPAPAPAPQPGPEVIPAPAVPVQGN